MVLGKSISQGDYYKSGYVKPSDIGQWTMQAFTQTKWFAGVALWEYSKDQDGSGILAAVGELSSKLVDAQNS